MSSDAHPPRPGWRALEPGAALPAVWVLLVAAGPASLGAGWLTLLQLGTTLAALALAYAAVRALRSRHRAETPERLWLREVVLPGHRRELAELVPSLIALVAALERETEGLGDGEADARAIEDAAERCARAFAQRLEALEASAVAGLAAHLPRLGARLGEVVAELGAGIADTLERSARTRDFAPCLERIRGAERRLAESLAEALDLPAGAGSRPAGEDGGTAALPLVPAAVVLVLSTLTWIFFYGEKPLSAAETVVVVGFWIAVVAGLRWGVGRWRSRKEKKDG